MAELSGLLDDMLEGGADFLDFTEVDDDEEMMGMVPAVRAGIPMLGWSCWLSRDSGKG
jgi:hypothetical protein